MTLGIGGLLLLLLVGLFGCEFFSSSDHADPVAPEMEIVDAANATHGHEGGVPAAYQPGSAPGIEIVADFAASKTHKEGKPWGQWIVEAYWRREPRTDVVTVFGIAFTIDDKGLGRAHLPGWFLDAVFADAAQRYQDTGDTSTWHHSPGLYLQIRPLEDTEDYYDFDPLLPEGWTWNLNSWSVAGSLEALVQALGLGWWPGLAPLTNVAALVDLGDPIGVEVQPPPTSSTGAGAGGFATGEAACNAAGWGWTPGGGGVCNNGFGGGDVPCPPGWVWGDRFYAGGSDNTICCVTGCP
jgi:hypothetical protein